MPRKYTARIHLPCAFCGTSIAVRPAQLTWGQGKYCSQSCYRASRVRPIAERLWSRVDKSGECWLWTGGKSKAGYGQIKVEGRIVYTHRLVYEMAYGPIAAGLEVCHDCPDGDNPAYCRPDHLFLGTHQENITDMITKGRKGKLSPADVREIRRITAAREATGVTLAARYGVTRQAIRKIVLRETWPHLD